ncbi:hypothetical protein JTB14_032157 [Gonioctena quinquepunctata]|nr:hypothetical protein JTB14_032157 [Gonioctena quinquepunctata]
MDVINNMEEILETMEYAAKRGEESTILSEQKENELTNDVDNIGLVDHGLSNIERNKEEPDSIEKMNMDHDPQGIMVKFEQFDSKIPSRPMDLINETKESESGVNHRNESSASITDEMKKANSEIKISLKKNFFENFEMKITKIDKKIHSAHSCEQSDVLKEELRRLHGQLEELTFKNEDDVKRNELKRAIHTSMDFAENRRVSLAVIEDELNRSSETHL